MNIADGVDWIPALAVLVTGIVLGGAVVWRALAGPRSGAPARKGVPIIQVRDLMGKRDALVRQLRELEDTASKRTPEQLAKERYALELEAARVLLALGERGVSVDERPQPKTAAQSSGQRDPEEVRRASRRGFLWGTGSAAGLLLLGFLVFQAAKPREAGDSVTGNLPPREKPAGSAATQDADPEEAEIKAALARNPDDLEAHLALARVHLGRREYMAVWNETKIVLDKSPGNPQAMAYQAMVRLAMGQAEVALGMLKTALASDPQLIDGYADLAVVYARLGRMKDAAVAAAQGSKRFPDRAAEFRQLLADLRTQPAAPGAGAAAGEADPHAGLGAPGGGTKGARSASARPIRGVSGTVDLDPAAASALQPGAVLFVFVRQAGVATGPPRAVKRLPPNFPVTFELSEADAMMGEPFPDSLLIEARLDSDGNPLTRSPTDPTARLDQVKAGRTDVHLILRRP